MSAFASLVMATACRSNHHRIAIDALRLLEGEKAPAWRAVFLHHYGALLEGAKAPDDRFKDFKNHVLHVREGDWGGAPGAAREWYVRTVRALQAGDWKTAAYNAGVMSHYVVDPVQPFHTGQTETEGVIHRAAEWSFSKSYAALRTILEVDLGGFPDVQAPDGPDWLEQMVKAGALASNPHYETIIAHYDLAAGTRNPPAGLDQELKDVMARLIGYACAMLARIFERAIADARVSPPQVSLALDAVFAVMAAPIRSVLCGIDNLQERAAVAAMYEEYRKTGKVRATLSQDDAAVRRLHAEEVLKVPLSSLDAQWPKETGLAHGQGAPQRRTQRPKGSFAAAPVRARPAAQPAQRADLPGSNEPVARPARQTVLHPDAPVEDAPAIGPKTAARLAIVGVARVADLLAADAELIARQLAPSHIDAPLIQAWQAQARLACALDGMTSSAAQLLVAAGIDGPGALAGCEVAGLEARIAAIAATPEGQRILRAGALPDRGRLEAWVAAAACAGGRAAA
jgi:hypothetical protein